MKKIMSLFLIIILLSSSISLAALSSDLTPPSRISEREEGGGGSATSTTHIYLNGKEITSIDSSGKRLFYHQDYLDSTRIVTDANGALVARIDYAPFGEELVDTTKTKYTFTGKEQDKTGLQYYGARYYDAETGRFTQVDPKPNPAESPYDYADNNPLKFVDPDGKQAQPPQNQQPQNALRRFTPEERNAAMLRAKGVDSAKKLEKLVNELGFTVDKSRGVREGMFIRDVAGDIVRSVDGRPMVVTLDPEIGTSRRIIRTVLDWSLIKGLARGVQRGVIIFAVTMTAARIADAAETEGTSSAAKQTTIEAGSWGGAAFGGFIGLKVGAPLGPWGMGICSFIGGCVGGNRMEKAINSAFEEGTLYVPGRGFVGHPDSSIE